MLRAVVSTSAVAAGVFLGHPQTRLEAQPPQQIKHRGGLSFLSSSQEEIARFALPQYTLQSILFFFFLFCLVWFSFWSVTELSENTQPLLLALAVQGSEHSSLPFPLALKEATVGLFHFQPCLHLSTL